MPDVSFRASLLRPDGSAVAGPSGAPSLGHSWSSAALTPFHLTDGHLPEASDEIVIDTALARRADVRGRPERECPDRRRRDRGAARRPGHARRDEPPAAVGGLLRRRRPPWSTTDAATRSTSWASPCAPGADVSEVAAALRSALGGDASVLTGDERGKAEFLDSVEDSTRLIAISGSLGGIGVFVAILVIAGMLSLFVRQRQREIGLLRAIGATPRQVRRMISRETLIVTALGAAVGVWPGLVLASHLASGMRGQRTPPRHLPERAGIIPSRPPWRPPFWSR